MTWRHTNAFSNGDCREWLPDISPYREACNCTTPTPDPTSPCSAVRCGDREVIHRAYGYAHAYRPSRCTCGHPIEEAPR